MDAEIKQSCTDHRRHEKDEEMADILTAISVVSRRLARKLKVISEQNHSDCDCCQEDGKESAG